MTSLSTASLHEQLNSDDWVNCLWDDVSDCNKKQFPRETGGTEINNK
jgi:hypothetical protein